MRESDEKVKQKLAQRKGKKKHRASGHDIDRRHFKGKSFALAHTQACYKDVSTIFTYRGFLFDVSGLSCEQTKKNRFMWPSHPHQSLEQAKIFKKKKKKSCPVILIEE